MNGWLWALFGLVASGLLVVACAVLAEEEPVSDTESNDSDPQQGDAKTELTKTTEKR